MLCPLLGLCLSNAMWTAPIIAMVNARKNRDLGGLNPIPFALIIVNCIGWVVYAFMIKNYYIFFSNATGVVIGGFLCMSSVQLLVRAEPNEKDDRTRLIIECIMLGGVAFWILVALITSISMDPDDSAPQTAVGIIADLATLMYYAAPLSTMIEVVKTKNAVSFFLPVLLANLANAVLWFFYGLIGIEDVYVWLPNGIGAILALSQISMKFVYPSKELGPESPSIALVGHESPISRF